jgi:drug/metabolite transporter (DMT)-like permease
MTAASRRTGISAALSSAVFLGIVPIFGKIAILSGFSPFTVIAIRTGIAALLMLFVMAIWKRQFFYIYPVGLVGCLLAGIINGLGSVLYYSALSRLNAGIGHLLYSFYPLFVAFWLLIDRQPITKLTAFRLLISIPAMVLLLHTGQGQIDLAGALMMFGSAVLYALHLLINQRILYEAPAPTVTLYTLIGMTFTVILAYALLDAKLPPPGVTWWAVLLMALITFFSRFALFMGIKHLGGLQTALLGLSEIFVTLIGSAVFLGERLSLEQWIGALLLTVSLILVGFDRNPQHKRQSTGWLSWLNPAKIPTADFNWPGHT